MLRVLSHSPDGPHYGAVLVCGHGVAVLHHVKVDIIVVDIRHVAQVVMYVDGGLVVPDISVTWLVASEQEIAVEQLGEEGSVLAAAVVILISHIPVPPQSFQV